MGIRRFNFIQCVCTLIIHCLIVEYSSAQFLENFYGTSLLRDPGANEGWAFFTGDGSATMDFQPSRDYATITVDATRDERNIWWALIRRRVSADMDLGLLIKPHYELRIETKIRISHAPRRVNLHLNTQRTTDFHTHLMEFDIPDTVNWYTISMSTHDFDAKSGDSVYGQLALMDWGLEKYRVDLDYFKVDIVNVDTIGPDKGVQVPYHPPVPNPKKFIHHVQVAQDGMIDLEYPEMNFNDWSSCESDRSIVLLAVSGTQSIIMRWDLGAFAGKKVVGSGLLELTTYSMQRSLTKKKDFGIVRVVEIMGGDPTWDQGEVTYTNLCKGQSMHKVFNPQMIIDVQVVDERNGKNFITISNPVLQRMIDGKTLGLAIRPLGAIHVGFYSMENEDAKSSSRLHFITASK